MSESPAIDDDELILRHIPGGATWQAPGARITSANFKLRQEQGETGVSVTRRGVTSPEKLLTLVRAGADSRVAEARVAEIRLLGLRVIPKPLATDPGHAEIQSDSASLDERLVRRRLANIFRFVDVTPSE